MINNSRKIVLKNTFMLYLMTFGKYLLPFLTLPYLTRVLTPHFYGIISYMTSIMVWIQTIVDFGYNFSATREATLCREDQSSLGKLLSKTIASKTVLSGLGFVLIVLMIPFVNIMKENTLLSFLYFLSVAVTAFVPDFIYRGLEKMEVVSIRFFIARLISTVCVFMFIKGPNDMLLVPILTILGNVVAVVVSYMHLFAVEKIFPRKISLGDVISSISYSTVYFIAVFATTAYGALSVFIMGVKNFSSVDIAYWNISIQIINAIVMLYEPIVSSLYPHMVSDRDYNLLKKYFCFFSPIVIIGTVFAFIFARFAILLVGGAKYIAAVPIFRLLLPVLIFSFPTQLLGFPVLAPVNKEKYATFSTIVAACFQLICFFLLFYSNCFDLNRIAIIYVCTNGVLCISRVLVFLKIQKNICRI